MRGAKPPLLPGQRFGRVDRPSHRATETPRRLRAKILIRKEGARLFAEYGVGAVGLGRVADALGMSKAALQGYYANRRDLLLDMLDEHLFELNEAVGAAFDARPAGPSRLEAVVAAWLDHVAADPHAHRTLHFSAHLLPPEQREAVSLKHRICLETAYLALTGAAPALAERPDLTEPLLGTMRALLDDPTTWPEPESLEDRTRRARRATGMM
ncbi:MAG TPA: TetR/AcrR family transcriptional regulator, partial [Acetobacteraceae bacterium]|nr:TetR/AcrR family transcriptional regulator [Acetobacteraceae bacterium]